MAEKPILFSGPMVQAILEGRKSVTRRIVKESLETQEFWHHEAYRPITKGGEVLFLLGKEILRPMQRIRIPYAPGDVLWVRETWAESDSDSGPCVTYRAGGSILIGGERVEGQEKLRYYLLNDKGFTPRVDNPSTVSEWKPSIFMPRWASRLTLEVTDVRIERLQEITEEEAVREGVFATRLHSLKSLLIDGDESGFRTVSARENFAELWQAINGKRASWESNPFVWRIEFRRIAPTT